MFRGKSLRDLSTYAGSAKRNGRLKEFHNNTEPNMQMVIGVKSRFQMSMMREHLEKIKLYATIYAKLLKTLSSSTEFQGSLSYDI